MSNASEKNIFTKDVKLVDLTGLEKYHEKLKSKFIVNDAADADNGAIEMHYTVGDIWHESINFSMSDDGNDDACASIIVSDSDNVAHSGLTIKNGYTKIIGETQTGSSNTSGGSIVLDYDGVKIDAWKDDADNGIYSYDSLTFNENGLKLNGSNVITTHNAYANGVLLVNSQNVSNYNELTIGSFEIKNVTPYNYAIEASYNPEDPYYFEDEFNSYDTCIITAEWDKNEPVIIDHNMISPDVYGDIYAYKFIITGARVYGEHVDASDSEFQWYDYQKPVNAEVFIPAGYLNEEYRDIEHNIHPIEFIDGQGSLPCTIYVDYTDQLNNITVTQYAPMSLRHTSKALLNGVEVATVDQIPEMPEVPTKVSQLENDSNFAAETYVDTKISNLVNSAPATLDTLGELATAFTENKNVVDALNSAITNKADKSDVVIGKGELDNSVIDNSAVLKGEYTVNGTKYKNKAISKVSVSVGAGSTAGLKGWYYTNVDLANKRIWLSDTRSTGILSIKISTSAGTTNTSFTSGWKEGDEVTIVNDKKYDRCAKITAINGNMITLDKLPFDSSNIVTSAAAIGSYNEPDEFSITAIRISDDDNKTRTVSSCDMGSVDFGGGAHAEGIQTYAVNIGAHAEGIQTVAYGQFSHTEGFRTEAAYSAHAEGKESKATGQYSHAEGMESEASGKTSHAEGNKVIASGDNSHAEGMESEASGKTSHAEGYQTKATADSSHAEGWKVQAIGARSHAEGAETIASGSASHAEGSKTSSNGQASHAEGNTTVAYGNYTHAEGETNFALGRSSHIEGRGQGSLNDSLTIDMLKSDAETYWDNAEATGTDRLHIAAGQYSHVEGFNNFAGADCAHVEGQRNKATGVSSHAEGWKTAATGVRAHAEGESTIAAGSASHAGGIGSAAGGKASFAHGDNVKATNANEIAFGKYNSSDKNTIFSIGNGTANDNRSNIFELKTVQEIQKTHPDSITFYATPDGNETIIALKADYKSSLVSLDGTQKFWKYKVTYIDNNVTFYSFLTRSNGGNDWYQIMEDVYENDYVYVPCNKPGWEKSYDNLENELMDSILRSDNTRCLYISTEFTEKNAIYLTYEISDIELQGHTLNSVDEISDITVNNPMLFVNGKRVLVEGALSDNTSDNVCPFIFDESTNSIFTSDNSILGDYSFAVGMNNNIHGDYSHAEGYHHTILGDYSHAEGCENGITGDYSHAEGYQTQAVNSYSHAEGYNSKATGLGSHAEGGYYDIEIEVIKNGGHASGEASHAEGIETLARNIASHAEGSATNANGVASHAEGYNSKAISYYTHAEGENTEARGQASHAEGYKTVAGGERSHAEGNTTTASGSTSHAEGHTTTASGSTSHAEGYKTIASEDSSHAEGWSTQANGKRSHAEGSSSIANGQASHAGGTSSTANGKNAFAHGNYATTTKENEVAFGKYNKSETNTVFSIGNGVSDTSRSNIFEIKTNGYAYVNNEIVATRAWVEANSSADVEIASIDEIDALLDSLNFSSDVENDTTDSGLSY